MPVITCEPALIEIEKKIERGESLSREDGAALLSTLDLHMAGAERLLGRGDMLFLPIDAPKPRRVQGALVTGKEPRWAAGRGESPPAGEEARAAYLDDDSPLRSPSPSCQC